MSRPANRSVSALLVVPPALNDLSGPLLGPALLRAAGLAGGHQVEVLDLNARWLRERLAAAPEGPDAPRRWSRSGPGGLKGLFRTFEEGLAGQFDADPAPAYSNGWITACASHEELLRGAERIATSPDGDWISAQLTARLQPDLVGLSVLYAGQVPWGLAVSTLVRRRWPGARIVWGGAHVTALRHEIARDARYGALVDGFVFGAAEGTFGALLDALAGGHPWPEAVVRAGQGVAPLAQERVDLAPAFEHLELYGAPDRLLPVQLTRGCPYGRCRYCTYPAVEGSYRRLDHGLLRQAVDEAVRTRSGLSFKDSLLTKALLGTIAREIAGKVAWEASTKLCQALDRDFLAGLVASGCSRLEVGLESLDPEVQELVGKRQDASHFTRLLDDAAAVKLPLVVNYMTGFPHETAASAGHYMQRVFEAFEHRRPELDAVLHHNTFQLERLAPLALEAARFGIRVTRSWPWATVLDWEEVRSAGRPAPLAVLP